MSIDSNHLPTPHANLQNRLAVAVARLVGTHGGRKTSLQVLLFISQCEIKSGIHEPRIGNADHAGDAVACDTPAKV